MNGALGKVDGVMDVAIKAGDDDFTVTYDSSKLKPADIVTKLQAAGEKGAKVKG